jgi:methionyl aminopeptidase
MIVQTQEQRDVLVEGGKRLGALLRELGEMCKSGVSTQNLEDRAREIIEELGDTPATLGYSPSGAQRPYPAALCVSVNQEIVHGIPNEDTKILQDGDLVSIDCLLKHNGLIVDSCITVGVGNISKESQRLINAAKEARTEALKMAKAGNTVGDIGHAVEQVAIKYGYSVPHELGGHGVGECVHEDPFVPNYGKPGSGERLVEGMVLAIEPILIAGKPEIRAMPDGYTYESRDGSYSAQFEHTVIIGLSGPEVLTA